ncbi:MAG: Rpn family recombination-promoting nuclease/putative transposase [Bacteroidales bacterium]|nr:Rpn family recombination-promoting nuclease/putative transposase [Bacteroidales bacterium]
MSKYLDPKVDLTFKKVFGEHKNLVISLLNSLLPLPKNHIIESIEYLSPEQIPENPGKKYSIVDVKCKDNYDRYFIVEMQTYWNSAYFYRTLYNVTKLYSSQLETAEQFDQLHNVYALSIVDVNKIPEFKDYDEYIQTYFITNNNHIEDKKDAIVMSFVDIRKYKPITHGEKLLKDLWLQFFTQINEATEIVDQAMLNNKDISQALEILKRSAYTDAEIAYYEKSRLNQITERSALKVEREVGREEGRLEGRMEGRKEGKEEGRLEEKIDNIKALMKNMNLDFDTVVKVLNIPKDYIEKLRSLINE